MEPLQLIGQDLLSALDGSLPEIFDDEKPNFEIDMELVAKICELDKSRNTFTFKVRHFVEICKRDNQKDLLVREHLRSMKHYEKKADLNLHHQPIVRDPLKEGEPLKFTLTKDRVVGIEELFESLNVRMLGKFFLCRVVAPTFGSEHLSTIADDPLGVYFIRVTIIDFKKQYTDNRKKTQKNLPVGSYLAVKNPWYVYSNDGGCALHCTNPEDLIIIDHLTLDSLDEKTLIEWLADVKWKGRVPDVFKRLDVHVDLLGYYYAFQGILRGDRFFSEEKYSDALQEYHEAMCLVGKHIVLLERRCMTYQRLRQFKLALEDADAMLETKIPFPKAHYHKAVSLCGLKQYFLAIKSLDECTLAAKPDDIVAKGSEKLKRRLNRQLDGNFDIKYFAEKEKTTAGFNAFDDCAEFMSPYLEFRVIRGKGKGLIAKKDFKPGEIIMACKAFVVFDPTSEDPETKRKSIEQVKEDDFYHDELAAVASKRLEEEPYSAVDFYRLYAGPQMEYLNTEDIYEGQIDANRIKNICVYNSRVDYYTNSKTGPNFRQVFGCLTIEPSYINHSCICNCVFDTFREFTFVKSVQSIGSGTELSVAYWDPKLPYDQRMAKMQKLSFICRCSLCQADIAEGLETHVYRSKILKDMKPYLTLNQPNFNAWRIMTFYLRELERIRPNLRLNYPIIDIVFTMARQSVDCGKYVEAMAYCKKGAVIVAGSPFVVMELVFVTIINAIYVLSDNGNLANLQEKATWLGRLNRFMTFHGKVNPAFASLRGEIALAFKERLLKGRQVKG